MKSSRWIVAVLLLSLALVCFISAPVFSGGDPWDVDGSTGGGSGTNGDSIVPIPQDSLISEGTHVVGDSFGPDWLSGITFQLSYQVITYFFGNNETSGKRQAVVERSSGNVTAQ